MNRMVDSVFETEKNYPEKIALQFMGRKTTYKLFIEQIKQAASALIEVGVKEGDIICVIMPNVPQAIILIYAANLIGAVVNMIHPLSSESEIKEFIKAVDAKTVLVFEQFQKNIIGLNLNNVIVASAREAISPLKRMFVKKTTVKSPFISWKEFLKKGHKNVTFPESNNSMKTALILHSGGTTGKVKGVCLSNNAVNSSAIQMREANPMICSEDRFLSVMPIFHGNGLVIGIHAVLMAGARCVLIPRFSPDSYAKDLVRNKCNYMSGVPALYERLIQTKTLQKADLSFIKGVFCGADCLSVELESRINEFLRAHNCKVPVRQGYGMTEGVVATTLNPCEYQKPGSIGVPLNGVNVKIVKPGTDIELGPGEIGEIIFSSCTNMTCYYNNSYETNLVMRTLSDGTKWIYSGDLGFKDNDGFFFFKGRIKRMIVVNGYNIFPNELENIIESFPMVDRCCIFSNQVSESMTKIVAAIKLKDNYNNSEEMKNKIICLCRSKIARYAIPKDIMFIEQMPKTKVGKIDYNGLLSIYLRKKRHRQ